MSGISVVIPAIGHQSDLDDTLVSVLEIQRANWQVIVPCDSDYEDPYGLENEVQFLRVDDSRDFSGWPTLASAAIEHSTCPLTCVLMPGVQLNADFAQESRDLFDQDHDIAAIAPRLDGIQAESVV